MKTKERLLECKIKLKISSDYSLAKALGINRGTLSGYMTGKRTPNAYAAIKMAEILKVHPLLLLAEFEGETEKNEEIRSFWVNFAQRIKAGTVGTLVLISTAFWSPEPRAEVGSPEIRIMPHYGRKRPRRLTITSRLIRAVFFRLEEKSKPSHEHLHSSSFVFYAAIQF